MLLVVRCLVGGCGVSELGCDVKMISLSLSLFLSSLTLTLSRRFKETKLSNETQAQERKQKKTKPACCPVSEEVPQPARQTERTQQSTRFGSHFSTQNSCLSY